MLPESEETAMSANNDDRQLVESYLNLRRGVGLLGVALPVILPFGVLFLGSSRVLQESISDYHGTVMKGVFVGALFAIGMFLFSYAGYEPSADKKWYEPSDNLAGHFAGVFALGVALFPVTSDSGLVRIIHFVSAGLLFLTLSYFLLHLFTKTKAGGTPSPEKRNRNKIYVFCGRLILVCIVLILIYSFLPEDNSIAAIKPVFWLESIALWAFGASWFIKGDTLFKDPLHR